MKNLDEKKLISSLMLKRLMAIDIMLLLAVACVGMGIKTQIIFIILLLIETVLLAIALLNKPDYPSYCYIYKPFKILFDDENAKAGIKRQKSFRKYYIIWCLVLAVACYYSSDIVIDLSVLYFKYAFILLFVMTNVPYILKICYTKGREQ